VVGLTRAFIFAGTPSVIATLWSVDDQATGLLMEHFYRFLRAGADKAAALQRAHQGVRKAYPHPYFWGRFCAHRGWGKRDGAGGLARAVTLNPALNGSRGQWRMVSAERIW
jgi:CHAT domain